MKFLLQNERLIVIGITIEVEEVLLERGARSVELVSLDRFSGFELVALEETSGVELPVVEAKPAELILAGLFSARHVIASCQH